MPRIVLTIFFAAFFISVNGQRRIDILHYKFNIDLNDVNDTIYGKAEILVKFLQPVSAELVLDLSRLNEQGRGMIADKAEPASVIKMIHAGDSLRLLIKKPYGSGDTARFVIYYHGIPADGLIISKNKYGKRTFFADNWPNRGHNWIPCHDDPADKAGVEFIVTAPQHYQVVANGIEVEESNLKGNLKRTHWKEDVPISTKVMVIGVAEFAVSLSGVVDNCIPVYSWVYPEEREKGFYDYAQAAEILPFFIKHIGPYPYKKLANVESKTRFGGLENANTIFYSENSITGGRESESLLVHEIAHQWFGNMATEKSFAHLWLSEGFATYMTTLYMENKYGTGNAVKLLQEDRDQLIDYTKTSNRSVVDQTTRYMELLNPNSYQKGGWVLHMLRRELGDSVFWKGIRSYYATYAGKTADTDDLRKIFETVSGKKLEPFFRQWLFTPGIPVLDISWTYQASKKNISVTVTQKKGLFEFPLEILVQENKTTVSKNFTRNINASTVTFTIPVTKKPVRVVADPHTSLLFEGTAREVQ